RCIGKGFCGSIWALEDSTDKEAEQIVIKREDGGRNRSVKNDYEMHCLLLQSAQLYPPSMPLLIPQCHELIQADNDIWWTSRLEQFPSGYFACRALITERISKVPRFISDKIVDLCCPANARANVAEFVKKNPCDDDCLIRPYLGADTEKTNESRFRLFSLRNVPLHIDQMRSLDLDVKRYAATMAETLALMHWGAGIDANDVEFVLAPPRNGNVLAPTFQSEFLGSHCMWILDFDCCREMSMDEVGFKKACDAFFRNDPYYPRPGTGEAAGEELWVVFKQRFLECSKRIMGEG
ncbi:hypothetical protein IQ06DRAFT_201606, partial [Phaeosphaeriaceae sp. SRC1lsM3a]